MSIGQTKKSNSFSLKRGYTNYHTIHVSFLCTNIGMKASDSYLQSHRTNWCDHKYMSQNSLSNSGSYQYMKRVSEVGYLGGGIGLMLNKTRLLINTHAWPLCIV